MYWPCQFGGALITVRHPRGRATERVSRPVGRIVLKGRWLSMSRNTGYPTRSWAMRVVTQRQQTPPGQTEPSRAGDAERSRADALRDRMDAMEAELVMAREPGASSQAPRSAG
jgi:hypothetical protein